MNQYLIIANDFTDPEALQRRMQARPKHFDMVRSLKAKGNFVAGGAILNEAGTMCGSSLIVQFEREEELHEWLQREPYILHKVWDRVEVKPFRVAEV